MSDRWAIKCRILTDNEVFVHGWEMGMLWMRMAGMSVQEPPTETRIEQTIHSVNDEQAIVAAGAAGWRVVEMRREPTTGDETSWTNLIVERLS